MMMKHVQRPELAKEGINLKRNVKDVLVRITFILHKNSKIGIKLCKPRISFKRNYWPSFLPEIDIPRK